MKASEKNALKSSDGKRLEESDCYMSPAEWKAMQKEQRKRKRELEALHGTKSDVIVRLRNVTKDHNEISLENKKSEMRVNKIGGDCLKRKSKHKTILEQCKRDVVTLYTCLDELGFRDIWSGHNFYSTRGASI